MSELRIANQYDPIQVRIAAKVPDCLYHEKELPDVEYYSRLCTLQDGVNIITEIYFLDIIIKKI